MQRSDVIAAAIKDAIERRPARFQTKDVSSDPAVRQAHGALTGERSYNAMIGRWIAWAHVELKVRQVGPASGDRGVWWEKDGAARAAQPIREAVATRDSSGLGPQYAKDPAFRARMRRHQSWWRHEVLKVPCGVGPTKGSTTPYGNMLDDAGSAQLLNFLNDDIRDVYRERARAGGGVEPFRATRNLLSSQPMAFNLFGYLAKHLDLATRVFARVLPGEVATVTGIDIEWAPSPSSRFLDDRTSFDAFVRYSTPAGQPGFLGIEVKLSEPFTQHDGYDGKAAYQAFTRTAASPWREEAWDRLPDKRWCQLWRDQLLVEALRLYEPSGYAGRGRLALVRHPEDTDCTEVVSGYTRLLRDPTSLADLPLDQLGTVIAGCVTSVADQRWWAAFARRYLELDLSGPPPAYGGFSARSSL